MPNVESTAITRVQYQASTRQLMVTFRESGWTYTYFDVPADEYHAFVSADSKGRFFNERIKDWYNFVRE